MKRKVFGAPKTFSCNSRPEFLFFDKLRKIIRRKRRSIYPQLQKIMFVKSVGY